MLRFEYHPSGVPVADSKVEEWIQYLYVHPLEFDTVVYFSTDNVIYCARMLSAQGKIPYLHFLFEGKPVEEDVLRWPEGFGGRVLEWETAWLRAKQQKRLTIKAQPRLPDPAAYPEWVYIYTVEESFSRVKCRYRHIKCYTHGGRCEPECPTCKRSTDGSAHGW